MKIRHHKDSISVIMEVPVLFAQQDWVVDTVKKNVEDLLRVLDYKFLNIEDATIKTNQHPLSGGMDMCFSWKLKGDE